ncbi:MAG: M48 family metallopeptidase [Burkholderiales bacterium]|jgi:predicted Zn-dependent protease|nr:M48 family metallopeptidase [Burkholderiales bacterium]
MHSALPALVLALFTLLTVPSLAQQADAGVQVRKPKLMVVPESVVNRSAAQQYLQMKQQAAARGLLNRDAPQVARVQAIALRLIPHGRRFNAEAGSWAWEVNVIDSPAINAFCMPGGKIMVFVGLIEKLQLTDDELAAVIGHEIAHALLQHGRARMSEAVLKNVGVNLAALYFGLGDLGATALAQAAQLAITLPYSRGHETDADLAGIELAARAGYDPRAATSLWRKMAAAGGGQPPQFLSTHPGHANRIREIEASLPTVMPLYEKAKQR